MEEQPLHIATLTLGAFDGHGTTRTRYFGRLIEVEHGLPDEKVRAEILGNKRPRGRIVEVLKASPERVSAPCPYFRDWACGGCQWQHISYSAQLDFKRAEVEEAMRKAGLDLIVTATHTLEDPWRYRSSAGIALGKSAGFRRHGSLAIVPIRDCPISHSLIGEVMARLNDLLESTRIPDFRGRVRIDVRVTHSSEGDRLQALVRPHREHLPVEEDLKALTAALLQMGEFESVSIEKRDGSIDTLSGNLFGQVLISGSPVALTAASFFQTNLELLPTLITRMQEEAGTLAGKRVIDLYGGVGIFGLFLGRDALNVTIVESDAQAVSAGEKTAKLWGLSNTRFLTMRAEENLEELVAYDVVVLDPPRAGLSPQVLESLVASRPSLILYVSCLAESLARDLHSLLQEGYTVDHLELFDFYPQTYHVELLAVLRLQ
ncbi:MAG: 23S rRNA (uracil(1939)-C(5))-methyltransferase RlmD [Chloroflexota bacterium]